MNFQWLVWLVLSVGSSTFLFPALASLVYFFSHKPSALKPLPPQSIEVLIPVFNEAETIHATLQSVAKATEGLKYKIKVVVGIDGSSDETPAIVREFAAYKKLAVEILDRKENRGKWATLVELVLQSQCAWTVLLDSGTLWPEDFLKRVASELEVSECVGIAPGYRNSSGGVVSRLVWWQERLWKSMENFAGGPVSLHGATMVFRTEELKAALRTLGARQWLNDDVVIALGLRQLGTINYLGDSLLVGDCGVKQGANEVGRRKRILVGNVQWIKEIYLPGFLGMAKNSPAVVILCLRRVFRTFWAYQAVFSAFCVGMLFTGNVLSSSLITLAVIFMASFSRPLREAGRVSLSMPFLISKKDASWT
jgi:glycosyltransferase involved in cell wall biosynthesis